MPYIPVQVKYKTEKGKGPKLIDCFLGLASGDLHGGTMECALRGPELHMIDPTSGETKAKIAKCIQYTPNAKCCMNAQCWIPNDRCIVTNAKYQTTNAE